MGMAISSSTKKLWKSLQERKSKWSQISFTIVSLDCIFSKNPDEVQEEREQGSSILQTNLFSVHILSVLCPVAEKQELLPAIICNYVTYIILGRYLVIFTCTLLSGRFIFMATSSLMKMSGYFVLAKSSSSISSWDLVKVVRSRRCFLRGPLKETLQH